LHRMLFLKGMQSMLPRALILPCAVCRVTQTRAFDTEPASSSYATGAPWYGSNLLWHLLASGASGCSQLWVCV
jgi:hypothetical protein